MSVKDKGTSAAESSIDQSGIDRKRRRLLVGGAAAVGGVGAAALALPMIASMSPSARAKAAGAPVEASVGKMSPGQLVTVEWRGKPVWVVNRTEKALALLTEGTEKLADPESAVEMQPSYVDPTTRAIKAETFVVVGICTHLGCSPSYRPEIAAPDLGSDWDGGFFCPCHGSKFDMAGRVYKGVPAPYNLEVPPHRYSSDSSIVVGEDPQGEGAAA